MDAQGWAEAPEAPGYVSFDRDDPSLPPAALPLRTLQPPVDTVIVVDPASGGRRWLRLVADLEPDDEGVAWLIGAVTDLTAVTVTQRRVLESERNFRTAIEALGEAFALFDPQERMVFCNEQYRNLCQHGPETNWVGVRYEDILRTEVQQGALPMDADGPAVEAWVQDRLQRFRRDSSDQLVQLRDGRWLRLTDRRTADGFHVSFRIDVTEMQRALHEADAASRSKSQFLAAMSHEIRTPMNAVLGMLKLLQFTELSSRQLELVDKSSRAARSLLDILNDILDFSKVEAGKMVLNPEPFVLEQLLSDLSPILSSTLGGKSLELAFDIDPALPPVLVGDVLRLKQVLINLLGNAIKFTSIGEVVLHIDRLAQGGDEVQVRFQVQDTGIGIAPAQQQQVFSDFAQAETFIARKFGGTGLGLSISQRLVKLMGGTLSLQSELGRGSTFGFEITLRVPAPSQQPQAAAAPRGEAPRVWLAGCQPSTRHALQRGLAALGCQVDTGEDWVEAAVPPDLVVSESRIDAQLAQRLRAALSRWAAADRRVTWFQLVRGADVETPAVDQAGQTPVRPDQWLVKPVTAQAVWRAYAAGLATGAMAEPQAMSARTGSARLSGLRLLLVEDNAFNQEVAQAMLSREGADVVVADHGLAALSALRDQADFDLVLMDMQMPVMDGLQATQAIRRQDRFRALPIVAMTANAMAADREACLHAGMNAHIGKPFDLDQVVELVLAHTGRSASPTPGPTAGEVQARPPAVFAPEAALQRLGGDPRFFERLLLGYPDTLQPQLGELRAAVAAADAPRAAAVLHRLKGSAASTGAEQLTLELSRLEAQAKAGTLALDLDALDAAAQAALAAQHAWCQAQAQVHAATPASVRPPVDEALVALAALETAVRHGDLGVFDACADWAERFAAPWDIDTATLSAAVDGFDATAALDAIRVIRQQLGG